MPAKPPPPPKSAPPITKTEIVVSIVLMLCGPPGWLILGLYWWGFREGTRI